MMVRRQGDWLAAKVGDELVMMSAENGNYVGLSEVGARIWELIETPQAVDQLCARLQNEFDVTPAVCRAEVTTTVGGPSWRARTAASAGHRTSEPVSQESSNRLGVAMVANGSS